MNNIFAERLKIAMEQKNMKQIDLVKKAAEQGVKLGKSHVSQYLSGKTTPRSEILYFLANTLEVEADWLKGNDTHPNMSKISTQESFQKELAGVEDIYKEITGKEMTKFYRPPQGIYRRIPTSHF